MTINALIMTKTTKHRRLEKLEMQHQQCNALERHSLAAKKNKLLRQSINKVPLKMLLLILLWPGIAALTVATGQFNDFVTQPRGMHVLQDNEALTDYVQPAWQANERNTSELAYHVSRVRYKLRYQPAAPMPKLFWHKFPQQAEPPAETTKMPATTTTELPAITTTTPRPTELATMMPSVAMPTTATTTTTTTTQVTKTTRKPATTPNTVMRPPNRPTVQLGNKLKNLLLFGSPLQANIINKQTNAPLPKGKGFLNLFEIIKFENTKCSVSMDAIRTLHGVCYHEFECKSLGGIATERCAEGVGVCCIFLTSCGDTTKQAVAYFESPNYPNAVREMLMCVLVVDVRQHVQQLRLDFLMFELSRPNNGDCEDDQFIVSGQNMNFVIPVLCGINTGQHIYVHVSHSFERKVYLTFISKVPSGGRSFNIKITQLDDDLAPENCLQYFTETEGVLKSFNYDNEGSIVDNREATYLNNLNYVICLARGKEVCSVTYTVEQLGGDQLDFQIVNKDEEENDLVPDGQAGAGIFNCPDDYVGVNQVRLCGDRFNDGTENEDFTMHAPVRDQQAGPILLPVKSDAEYVGRGFRLTFKQEMCI